MSPEKIIGDVKFWWDESMDIPPNFFHKEVIFYPEEDRYRVVELYTEHHFQGTCVGEDTLEYCDDVRYVVFDGEEFVRPFSNYWLRKLPSSAFDDPSCI